QRAQSFHTRLRIAQHPRTPRCFAVRVCPRHTLAEASRKRGTTPAESVRSRVLGIPGLDWAKPQVRRASAQQAGGDSILRLRSDEFGLSLPNLKLSASVRGKHMRRRAHRNKQVGEYE